MKIVRENTENADTYLAGIYPFLAKDATPRRDLVLTVDRNYTDKKAVMRGLGHTPLDYEQVLQLQKALDAVLNEMDTIARLSIK